MFSRHYCSCLLPGALPSSLLVAYRIVAPGTQIPLGSLVMGNPGRVKRILSDDECCTMQSIAERYIRYLEEYRKGLVDFILSRR